jgi:hypothetical protein
MIIAAFVVMLLAVAALTFLSRFLLTMAGRRVGAGAALTLTALEEIVDHGRVPAAWIEDLGRRMPGAVGGTPRQRQAARRFLLGRLAGLKRYCARSTMIDGPETLAILLEGIGRAEREWREKDLEQIVRGTGDHATEA